MFLTLASLIPLGTRWLIQSCLSSGFIPGHGKFSIQVKLVTSVVAENSIFIPAVPRNLIFPLKCGWNLKSAAEKSRSFRQSGASTRRLEPQVRRLLNLHVAASIGLRCSNWGVAEVDRRQVTRQYAAAKASPSFNNIIKKKEMGKHFLDRAGNPILRKVACGYEGCDEMFVKDNGARRKHVA